MVSYFKKQGAKDNAYSVVFYNLDNLFDIFDDPYTLDDDFTPYGEKKWTYRRYKNKINKVSEVLSQIGLEYSLVPPVIIGVAELENEDVIIDLIESKKLRAHNYGYVHYDSPDERGIDVGFLYQKKYFKVLNSQKYPLIIFEKDGDRDYTRDILLVEGFLNGERLYVIVNHWPSRREGKEESEYKRIAAAKRVHGILDDIEQKTANAKIIIMGDFNDGPYSPSIKKHLLNERFHNPMERLKDKGEGTSVYDDDWYLFDQIIFSKNFLEKRPNTHRFKYADVFDPKFIRTWKGKRKNNPYRTYIGKWHQGGYSDHFPVYAYLVKRKTSD